MISKIGKGSMAEEHGYSFDLLLGWLEDISSSELEKAETKPRYEKRAHMLEDALEILRKLQ